jgi:integrase
MPRPRGQRGEVQELGRTWRIRYWEDGPDGQRRRQTKGGFPSRAAAERALRKVLTEIDEGTYVAPRPVTVGEFLAGWLEAQRPHVAANSWVTARNHVAYYLAPDDAACAAYRARTGQERPSLGGIRLQELTAERVSRHWSALLARGKRDGSGLAPRTVRGVRITLSAALASAASAGLLSRPLRLKRVQVPKRRPTVYTPEQTRDFLAVAARDRLAALWVLLVTSALRPSEALGLAWPAVDLEAGVVSVYQKLIKVGKRGKRVDGTKTDGSAAVVVLDRSQ